MGKLFGKDKKAAPDNSAESLDAFLHSAGADQLDVTHAPPPPPPSMQPKLAKLDTTISRYPQALAVNQQAQMNRPVAPGRIEQAQPRATPRPNRKGTFVRFADSYPEVIGEGGDECEIAVVEVRKNRTAKPPPPPTHNQAMAGSVQAAGFPGPPGPPGPQADDFQPKPLARTATGYSSIYSPEQDDDSPQNEAPAQPPPPQPRLPRPPIAGQNGPDALVPGRAASARYLDAQGRRDENRRSYIEIHHSQMREAEGKAFALAARTASTASQQNWEDGNNAAKPYMVDSPDSPRRSTQSPDMHSRIPQLSYSPAASISSNGSSAFPPVSPLQESMPFRQISGASQSNLPIRHPSGASYNEQPVTPPLPPLAASRAASVRQPGMAETGDGNSLGTFVARTKHLFELFRLHAETVKPLQSCDPRDCARAGLWWFLKGRMGLELAIRDRPSTPQSQMQNELDRQQAYSNLAKGHWLYDEAIPEIARARNLFPDEEVTSAGQALKSGLLKLAQSMKRNGYLPPEEPFLPQTIDKSIWLEYPPLSQDMLALLSGNWGSGITAVQHPLSTLRLLDSLPVGDTAENFNYGRFLVDAYLTEQGRDAHRILLPCILSTMRPQRGADVVFVLASQNGSVQLAIQENKNAGPVWEDVRWNNGTCSLEVRLPRGFLLVAQLGQHDYRMVWNMYDFATKVKSTLRPRSDEVVVFRNSLRSFQYLDADPQSRAFPKDSVPQCDVALFERVYKENGPSGPRSWHRGFRIAVVTGPRTRALSGVQHSFPPQLPVQFGFFRAEGDAPSLSVKYVNGRQRGRMIFVFGDEKERIRFHSLLTGTALNHEDRVFADVPVKAFSVAQSMREPTGMPPFSRMPWKAARVINDEFNSEGDAPGTVLADRLRVVLEYQNGTVTDRVNVAPGELRVRLEVTNALVLRVLRQPQKDMTLSVSEAQVPKELPATLADALQLVDGHQTIRTYEFNNLKDLHVFQTALTGYEVVFDALAVTFAIARRRMVVPIHKKWEAGYTRIQVVRMEDRQLQLLAFFEDFQHGHCLNFVLKGTDVFESFQRGSKAGIKIVDAKFPLPRLPAERDGDVDDMAFVCLDLPDLPGEHDDISIMFEAEAGRLSPAYVRVRL